MISVLSQLTNTFGPWLFELVSIYINAEQKGGNDVAPEWKEGLCVFVDLMKFDIFPLLFFVITFDILFLK